MTVWARQCKSKDNDFNFRRQPMLSQLETFDLIGLNVIP